jgi:hypothetical protein
MLTFNPKSPAAIDLDNRSLLRISNMLLGKARTEEKMKQSSPKDTLRWIGELEEAASAVFKNRKAAFPADVSFKRDAEEMEQLRWEMVQEFQSLKNLSVADQISLQFGYRIRGLNQHRAMFENEISPAITRGDKTLVNLRVSFGALPNVVANAEKTGTAKLSINLSEKDVEFQQVLLNKPDTEIQLVVQDELSERPEVRRNWIGNIIDRCKNAVAEKEKTTILAEATPFLTSFSGKQVPLVKKVKVTNFEKTKNGIVLSLEFPEIISKIEAGIESKRREAGKTKPTSEIGKALDNIETSPGKGSITQSILRLHTAQKYGCSAEDFLKTLPEIMDSLKSNLEAATKTWTNKTSITEEDTQTFLREYSLLSLTLRKKQTPKAKLEPVYTTLKDIKELNPHTASEPSFQYIDSSLPENNNQGYRSLAASAGTEWTNQLAEKYLEDTYASRQGETYAENLKNLFQIEDVLRKQNLIEANFFQLPNTHVLDGSVSQLSFKTPYWTEDMEAEFQLKKEIEEQEVFSASGETATQEISHKEKEGDVVKDVKHTSEVQRIQKEDFLDKTLTLELPNQPAIVHRLLRYPSSNETGKGNVIKSDSQYNLPVLDTPTCPQRENKEGLTLKDCLTPEFFAILQKEREENQTLDIEIKGIEQLLFDWQAPAWKMYPKYRLQEYSKNPVERTVWQWLENLVDDKSKAKCQNLTELRYLFNNITRQAGRIPFETDKLPEHFRMPVHSNPIPLKLLCGTGYEDLAELSSKKNPLLLWDFAHRWQNAESLSNPTDKLEATKQRLAGLKASLATLREAVKGENLPGGEKKKIEDKIRETRTEITELEEEKSVSEIEELEAVLQNENKNDNPLEMHAIYKELQNTPNWKKEYLQRTGLEQAFRTEAPAELRRILDVLYIIPNAKENLYNTRINCPETITIKGEETPIEAVVAYLKSQEISIALTPEEKERIEKAPETALKAWQTDCTRSVSLFEGIENVLPNTIIPKIQIEIKKETLSEFSDIVEELHETLPQSKNDIGDIVRTLLTYNPSQLEISLPLAKGEAQRKDVPTLLARKSVSGIWTSTSGNPQKEEIIALLNKAEQALKTPVIENPNAEEKAFQEMIAEAKHKAYQDRILQNTPILQAALNSIPPNLKKDNRIQELSKPLERRLVQLEELKEAHTRANHTLKNWMGYLHNTNVQITEEKNATSEWGWQEDTILNAPQEIELLCESITGNLNALKKEGTPSKTQAYLKQKVEIKDPKEDPKYLLLGLFSEKEKLTAVDKLIRSGKSAAAEYLRTTLQQNIEKIKETAAKEIPQSVNSIKTELNLIIKTSYSPETQALITKESPISHYIRSKEKTRLLESKIKAVAPEIAGANYKENVMVQISPCGTKVKSNKLWVNAWLETKGAASRIQSHVNLLNWLKETKKPAATALAFLSFCKHKNLGNVADAVELGQLDKKETEAVKTTLTKFETALQSIGIKENASLLTKLHGALAICKYTERDEQTKGRTQFSPWKPDFEKEVRSIRTIGTVQPKTMTLQLGTNPGETTKQFKSPFREIMEFNEETDGLAPLQTNKEKMSAVLRATSILHQPAFKKTKRNPSREIMAM